MVIKVVVFECGEAIIIIIIMCVESHFQLLSTTKNNNNHHHHNHQPTLCGGGGGLWCCVCVLGQYLPPQTTFMMLGPWTIAADSLSWLAMGLSVNQEDCIIMIIIIINQWSSINQSSNHRINVGGWCWSWWTRCVFVITITHCSCSPTNHQPPTPPYIRLNSWMSPKGTPLI